MADKKIKPKDPRKVKAKAEPKTEDTTAERKTQNHGWRKLARKTGTHGWN